MAGLDAAAWIGISSVVVAAAGSTVAAVQGKQSHDAQKRSLNQQKQAQADALQRAASDQRKQEMAQNDIAKKGIDAGLLLTNAQRSITTPTLLSSPQGIDPTMLQLGKTKSLGE